ncbi:unnamed protein product [Adineta steineri]|uniref:Uncharacterized protein n=1 Tax=Adineta steineri TaxID=433720 RepID=A0A813T6P2_9BILA|nr:unnamed protein product [Adineta steineri]
MLPKIRRVSSILRNNNKSIQSTERLSNKSSSSSSKSTDDGHNVYIETLLYIVHVDDIDLPISTTDEITEEMYDGGDEQQLNASNKLIRRMSKRTTASFNERHQTSNAPLYARPSFSFSNPLRRLNSILKPTDKGIQSQSTPKQTAKRSSSFTSQSRLQSQNNNNNDPEQPFPPPPSSLLYDNPISCTEQQTIIRAHGPGLTDGFINDNCHFDLNAPNAELQKLVIAIDGPSKADIQIEVIDTDIYRVFYTCETSGNYHISLTYDGEHINNSF